VNGTAPAGAEQAVAAPVVTPSKPGNVLEYLESFDAEQAKGAPTPPPSTETVEHTTAEKTPSKSEESIPGSDKKEEAEKAAVKAGFFVLDDKGNKVPIVIKADGKEYPVDSIDKLQTWASMGIHANTRLEDIKKSEGMLEKIMDAIASGRVAVKDGKLVAIPQGQQPTSAVAETPAKAEETDEFESPEMKRVKALETDLAKAKKDFEAMRGLYTEAWLRDQKGQLDTEIAKHKKAFPLAREKDLWPLLGETVGVDEKGDPIPKYSVEDAMKTLHGQELERFTSFKNEHPEFVDKQEIIAAYLKEKSGKETAPVSSPSGTPAPSPAPAAKKYANVHDALEDFGKEYEESLRAKKPF
jgi:hypothetical protein